MSSGDFTFITLRNITAYNARNSYIPNGYVLAASTFGKAVWTNAITVSSVTASTMTLNTLHVSTITGSTITANTMTLHSTLRVSSISTGLIVTEKLSLSTLIASTMTANSTFVSSIFADRIIGNDLQIYNAMTADVIEAYTVHTSTIYTSTIKMSPITIGINAGAMTQGVHAIAIGDYAGAGDQAANSIILNASGSALDTSTQGLYVKPLRNMLASNAVFYDTLSGELSYAVASAPSLAINPIAIGISAGQISQGLSAIAIGQSAGSDNQAIQTIAIGTSTGYIGQGQSAIAIGTSAGFQTQGENAIAIGQFAGQANQGQNAIAIGNFAGSSNQAAQSIVLNASGGIVDAPTTGLFVSPIREATAANSLFYDSTTKEVVYGSPIYSSFLSTDTQYVFNEVPTLITYTQQDGNITQNSGNIIIPISGVYQVSYSITYLSEETGVYFEIYPAINGNRIINSSRTVGIIVTNLSAMSSEYFISLNATDSISFYMVSDAASNTSTYIKAANNNPSIIVTIMRIA